MKSEKKQQQKRISIVSIKMVRESSVLYEIRKIGSPNDAVELGKRFLQEEDREKLIVCCLDTKNQPTAINVQDKRMKFYNYISKIMIFKFP